MRDELSLQARTLVRRARFANDPTQADRNRVHAAVVARLTATVVVTSLAVVGAKEAAPAATSGASVGSALVAKLAVWTLFVGVAFVGTVVALRQAPPTPAVLATVAPSLPSGEMIITAPSLAAAIPGPSSSSNGRAGTPHARRARDSAILRPALDFAQLSAVGGDRERRLGPGQARIAAVGPDRDWYCEFPPGSTMRKARVRVVVTVRLDGTPESVEIISDAGQSRLAMAASKCAMKRSYLPAHDAEGRPVSGKTPPFVVLYAR
jgi:hypothetical protein